MVDTPMDAGRAPRVWRRYRLWRAIWFAAPPLLFGAFWALSRAGERVALLSIRGVLVTVLSALYACAVINFNWFRCPRCRNHFHRRQGVQHLFNMTCLHCGLPRGSSW